MSYTEMVKDWGHDVLLWECFGSYQGDFVVLLRGGDRYGFLVIGYGSCGGCDAFESACDSVDWDQRDNWRAIPEVIQLAESLKARVRWDSAEGLADYLSDSYVQEQNWSWYEEGFKECIQRIADKLRFGWDSPTLF